MSKQRVRREKTIQQLRLWNKTQVIKALPLIRSMVRSLRENWLEMQQTRLHLRRIDTFSERPNRRTIILREEAVRALRHAEEKLDESLRELSALDVFTHDPVRGLALVPFLHEDSLAWYVFDMFSPQGLDSWRFHADPLEKRRPLRQESAPNSPAQE